MGRRRGFTLIELLVAGMKGDGTWDDDVVSR
ncbi:MAG: prepilin-type N-terminal cleavage/methylation domain-containing protein [Armatimonadota bacterium]